jgi:NADH-quinone oxidoreductase subunit N
MIPADLVVLSPLIVLTLGAVIVLMLIPFKRSHRLTLMLTLYVLLLCLASLPLSAIPTSRHATALVTLDGYALFFIALFISAAIAVCLFAYDYLEGRRVLKEEFYILILIATLGSSVIVSSNHFTSFFLGLELLSVSLYVLIAYLRTTAFHLEAAIKYLVLAATSVAFLLFGIALVYLDVGTMNFYEIAQTIREPAPTGFLFLSGIVLFLVGIGFKLAVVPFHLWTPDVYQGAPAPVTAFIATSSKGAILALLLRFFSVVRLEDLGTIYASLAIIAVASMVVGNILALLQPNLKRLLAYSSIAHLGYMLVAVLASGELAILAVSYYLVAYFVTTLTAFGVISILSGKEADLENISDYRGLAFEHFWLAALLTTALLSLAGIPLTAGFIAKFFIVRAGVGAELWALVIVLVVNSTVGLFYYLRVIAVLFARPYPSEAVAGKPAQIARPLSFYTGLTLTALAGLLIFVGVMPAPFIRLIQLLAMHLE